MNATPLLFDRELYRRHQASASGEAQSLILARVAEELADRLDVINRSFARALLIAPGPEPFSSVLTGSGKCAELEYRPLSSGDSLDLPSQHFNAVFSLLDLHAVNDVPGYMAQVAASLVPDGLALFAFFAGDTLRELRDAWLSAENEVTGGVSPRVAPMIDLRETGGLLQRAGLALPVADMDHIPLRYGNALTLMQEIKQAGFSNCMLGRKAQITSRRMLLAASEAYHRQCAHDDGRIPATLDVAWAMAWKPHPSQQQPLKPGSAKARLADALKVGEGKL